MIQSNIPVASHSRKGPQRISDTIKLEHYTTIADFHNSTLPAREQPNQPNNT